MAKEETTETEAAEPTVFQALLNFVHEHGDTDFPSTPNRKEKPQAYLEKFVQAISDVDEKTFDENVDEAAQEWFAAAVNAMNANEEVTAPEGFEVPAATSKRAERATLKQNKEAAKAEAEAGEGEAEKPKRKRREKAEAEAGPRGHRMRKAKAGFTTRSLRRLVIENPEISLEEMDRVAKEAGATFARSTLTVVRQSALITCSIVRECGWTPPATENRAAA